MLGTCFTEKKRVKKVLYFNMFIASKGNTSTAMANWSEQSKYGFAGHRSWL
jgi:hypothetical protein